MQQKKAHQRPVKELMDHEGLLEVHPPIEPQLAAQGKSRPYIQYHQRQQQPTAQPSEPEQVVVEGFARHLYLPLTSMMPAATTFKPAVRKQTANTPNMGISKVLTNSAPNAPPT